jgi:hypothetical protein
MQKYNFKEQISGDTFSGLSFSMNVNETPLNLTGAAIKIEFKRVGQSKAALTLSNSEGGKIAINSDGTLGLWSINPFKVELPAGIYEYDIQFTFPNTTVKTYIYGEWKIRKQVTK